MRTPGGQSASHIGIFVEIKITPLCQKQASSSGTCSLQDLQSPMKRFSFPKTPETYQLSSVDETVGDTVALNEQNSHSEEEKIATTCSLYNGAADGNNDTKNAHHKAIKQCVAEIHANPFTDDPI